MGQYVVDMGLSLDCEVGSTDVWVMLGKGRSDPALHGPLKVGIHRQPSTQERTDRLRAASWDGMAAMGVLISSWGTTEAAWWDGTTTEERVSMRRTLRSGPL